MSGRRATLKSRGGFVLREYREASDHYVVEDWSRRDGPIPKRVVLKRWRALQLADINEGATHPGNGAGQPERRPGVPNAIR